MKTRSLLLLILIFTVTLLSAYQVDLFSPPKVSAMDSTIFEYNHGPGYNSTFTLTTRWLSQTFTPEVSHIIKSVKLRVGKMYGIKPTLYVYICPVGADGKPIASEVLASGYHYFPTLPTWGGWLEVSLGDSALLQAGVTYSIVIWSNVKFVNLFYWTYSKNYYTGGQNYYSPDSGTTWMSLGGFDFHFEEWGLLPPQEPLIFESYSNIAGPGAVCYEPFQNAQTFIPQTRHILSRIYLRGYVPFDFGFDLTVKIMATNEGKPAGEPLAVVSVPHDLLPLPSGNYWISIDIPEEPELLAGVMYAIVVSHDATEPFAYRWTTDFDDDEGDYPNGTMVKSLDGGVSWLISYTTDFCFQEWGYPLE